jgi:hypothetical protein
MTSRSDFRSSAVRRFFQSTAEIWKRRWGGVWSHRVSKPSSDELEGESLKVLVRVLVWFSYRFCKICRKRPLMTAEDNNECLHAVSCSCSGSENVKKMLSDVW